MNIPSGIQPALWGMAGGAVVVVVAGFGWGGWSTAAEAERTASIRADKAVVTALAPVCVDNFRRASGAAATLIEFKAVDSWSQGPFVQKGGWANVPGEASPVRDVAVARACALLLAGP